jgi:3-hydroxypropionate dehydrogenase (NADP+)
MSEIQKATTHPERCVLAHPYNPPHLIPVVEVTPGEQTAPETVDVTYKLMQKIGKVPVLLKKEVAGYVSNRLQMALYKEILRIVEEDVASVEDIDLALSAGPGLRWAIMGPSLTFHLAGGPGGIDHFFGMFDFILGQEFGAATIQKVIQGVKAMKMVQTKSMEELVNWRDDKLVALLKILY